MKNQILILALIAGILKTINSAEVADKYLQEQTKQITQAIGQDYFPAGIPEIIAGYAASGPVEFIRQHGRQGFFMIYPAKKGIDINAKDEKGNLISRYDIAYDSKYNPNSTQADFYNLEVVDYNPDIQRGSKLDAKFYGKLSQEDQEEWLSLGVLLFYLLGVKKFSLGSELGVAPEKFYYPSPELKLENIIGRRQISKEDLIKRFEQAKKLLDRLEANGSQLVIEYPYYDRDDLRGIIGPIDVDSLIKNLREEKEQSPAVAGGSK